MKNKQGDATVREALGTGLGLWDRTPDSAQKDGRKFPTRNAAVFKKNGVGLVKEVGRRVRTWAVMSNSLDFMVFKTASSVLCCARVSLYCS